MSMISNALSQALTGTARTSALLISVAGVQATGELVIRGLGKVVELASFGRLTTAESRPERSEGKPPAEKGTWDTVAEAIQANAPHTVIRPYRQVEDWKSVAYAAVVLLAAGIALNEGVNFFEGTPPKVYNLVLSWLGPIRLHEGFYIPQLESASQAIAQTVSEAAGL